MPKKLLLIINPVSGLKLAHYYLARMTSILTEAGYDVFTMLTTKRGDAKNWVETYGTYFDRIVACGGDGTFNEVVSGNLKGVNKELGYVPCGSTNDFAASLGLSSDILTATEAAASGTVHTIDAGAFGERNFTYVASFGAFTKASYATPQNVKNVIGHLAYILEGGMELANLHPEFVSLEADGKIYEGSYIFGAISNSTSLGGILSLSPALVDMNDGNFEVMLIKDPENAIRLSRILKALTSQKLEECEQIEFFSTKSLKIIKNPESGWSLDGEFEQGEDGSEIRNLPSAIHLVF